MRVSSQSQHFESGLSQHFRIHRRGLAEREREREKERESKRGERDVRAMAEKKENEWRELKWRKKRRRARRESDDAEVPRNGVQDGARPPHPFFTLSLRSRLRSCSFASFRGGSNHALIAGWKVLCYQRGRLNWEGWMHFPFVTTELPSLGFPRCPFPKLLYPSRLRGFDQNARTLCWYDRVWTTHLRFLRLVEAARRRFSFRAPFFAKQFCVFVVLGFNVAREKKSASQRIIVHYIFMPKCRFQFLILSFNINTKWK